MAALERRAGPSACARATGADGARPVHEGFVEAAGTVVDGRGLVSLRPQSLGDEGGDALLVLDDQDLGHGVSLEGSVGRVSSTRAPRGSAS